ncbi:MAG: 2-C-methyl-D-erythritol 4-phosphate cytidylyltransferase [Candidatus Delongbacteria bacterium]|nr:2-C-methyl-D-erythritol 4-phosphate cytidylyltransferase [Candidatus Delongbacteria bacterium]
MTASLPSHPIVSPCTGILTAAGQGSRFGNDAGERKQWQLLNGYPLLLYGLDALLQAGCVRVLLTYPPADRQKVQSLLGEHDLTEQVTPVAGGAERQHSIRHALKLVPDDHHVAVHDGVRPLVGPSVIRQLLELAVTADGALPGKRITDTVKRVEKGTVIATLDRSLLVAVHTPQLFQAALLKKAYTLAERDRFLGTDDASLVERLPGVNLVWLEDDGPALKITTPADLEYAEYLVKEQHCADWLRF